MQNLDEQNKFNPLYWGGKAVSTIFSPEVLDVARESLFGDYRVDAQGRVHQDDIDKVLKQIKDPVGYHWKKQGDYYTKAQYEYSKLWDKKDIGGIGLRALSSPVSTVFVTSGLSFSLGMYSSSIHGSTKLLTLPKMLKGATITRSMAVDTAIGATFVGSAIHEVSTGNNEYTLNQKLQNFAIMTPSILGGAKIGYQKGTYRGATFDKTYKNMKSSFNDVYNRYMPQKVQDTFIKTKTNINKYDPWWGQRHTPTFVKTYFSRASSKSIQFKYNQFKFHRLHKRYVKDLKTYGKDLYPIAVKRGLVKDAGLAKQSELKIIPYSPADTIRYNIMPHSRPETETFYRDLKGGKKSFISIAKDKSGYSEGIIERINGEFSRVSGKSTYNVYTESEGFGALMPSKRTNYFSGVVKSKSIDIKHFDLTAQESIGSYHISPKVTTTKFGEPRSSGYSFGGRLFNENFSTRSVSITKNIEGSIPVADRYGFKRVDVPKMDYTITKGKITSGGIGEFSDKSLLIYPKEPSIKGFGSSGGGDFVGGGGSGSNIIGGGQIVKITPLSDFPTSNIFADAGSIGIFLRTGNMIKQQLGGGTSSATGSNMGQFVYADMKIVESGKGTNTIFKQQFVEPKMSGTNMKLNQSAFQDVKTVFRESTKNKNLFTPVSIHGYDTKLKWENITPSIMPSFSNNIKTDMGTSNIQSPMLFQGQSRFTSNESNMDMGNSNIMIPMLSFSQAQRRQSYSKSATRQVSISLLANVVTPPYYMKPLTSKIEPIIIDNADSYTKLPRLYFPDEKSKSKTKKKRKKKHDEFEIGYRIRRFKTPTISFDKEIKKINKMSRGIFK